jgi:hypothetical protein
MVVTMGHRRPVLLLLMIGLLSALLVSPVEGFAQGNDLVGQLFYREHCAICHGQDAAAHARRTLKLDGSRVILTRSGALLDGFLLTHGNTDGRERQELVALFLRLLSEGKSR